MESTPEATPYDSADPTVPVVSTILGHSSGQFLDVRGLDRAEGPHVATLRAGGWHGVSVRANEVVSPDGELHLLITDDSQEAPSVVETLGTRPWLVLTPSPDGPAITLDSYRHLLFDGQVDYYLANDHLALAANLARAAGEASESIRRWRASALDGWDERARRSNVIGVHQEMEAMRQTLSWRVTRPLRAVRTRMPARPTQ